MHSKKYHFYMGAPFLLINVVFILGVTFGIPLGDEWVWMRTLLIPLDSGEIGFSQYILGEYSFLSHSHYLALLFLLADYKWLELDFNYFTYIGVVFYALGYLSLLLYIRRFLRGNLWQDAPAIIIMSVGYFCITSDFPWLLVVFEYVYFFLAIILLISLDRFINRQLGFLAFLIIAFVTLLLGDIIGMAAVFICAAALLAYGMKTTANLKHAAVFVVLLVGFLVAQYFLLGNGAAVGKHARFDTLSAILKAPADVLISFMSIFSQPLVDITIFRYSLGERNAPILQFGLGVLGFTFICSIVFAYFYYQGWRKSWLPLLLIGYGCLSWLLIFVSRYLDLGVDVIDEPRYVRLLTLIYVGAGMALLCINLHTLAKRFYMISAAVLLAIYLGTVSYKFWQDQYIKSYFADARIEIEKTPIDSTALAKFIGRCASQYCDSSIEFMKRNRLSIFHEIEGN